MIKLIGTNHLMKKEEIESIINQESPDIICVEFCNTRLNLMVLNPPIEQERQDDTLIGKISNAIKKKAEEQKIEYGSDMINACKIALERNIPLGLIDMDIMRIKGLMEKIPQNEQQGFLLELQNFENQQLTGEVDENKVLEELKLKYPIAFEFLITLRELHIVKELLKIENTNKNKKILVFLGKGHLKSIDNLLFEEIKFVKGGKQ